MSKLFWGILYIVPTIFHRANKCDPAILCTLRVWLVCYFLLFNLRMLAMDGNLRTEPKFIVFLSQLLLLFKFCHFCKSDNPAVEARKCGTLVVVKSFCINPKCMKEKIWKSQPQMTGTKIPAGNLLLSMATLLAGGSISKVIQIFKHMNLCSISLSTFFKHQRVRCYFIVIMLFLGYGFSNDSK